MHPEQKQIFRLMTPEEKLRLMQRLYYSAWELKAAALREMNPQWSESEIRAKVKEAFIYAGNERNEDITLPKIPKF